MLKPNLVAGCTERKDEERKAYYTPNLARNVAREQSDQALAINISWQKREYGHHPNQRKRMKRGLEDESREERMGSTMTLARTTRVSRRQGRNGYLPVSREQRRTSGAGHEHLLAKEGKQTSYKSTHELEVENTWTRVAEWKDHEHDETGEAEHTSIQKNVVVAQQVNEREPLTKASSTRHKRPMYGLILAPEERTAHGILSVCLQPSTSLYGRKEPCNK
ncbi:hypothetical protein BJ508DRAFT_312598 [Ascobolus immersus RN42]|uniref:Uncharacterized protein n=1 Tax=Ascobolus immersus RN42 TaxID=1160509 RepID=A0A3N4HLR4_ASCIM|nr:hypothetical protein BJ508DRAFT_312598 [Ascobolus immersus RN42]